MTNNDLTASQRNELGYPVPTDGKSLVQIFDQFSPGNIRPAPSASEEDSVLNKHTQDIQIAPKLTT